MQWYFFKVYDIVKVRAAPAAECGAGAERRTYGAEYHLGDCVGGFGPGRSCHSRSDLYLVCNRCAGGLITAWLGGPVWLQVIVFLAVSALALVLVRPLASRFMKTSHSPTNADRVIGQTAIVTEAIDNVEGKGQVNIAGQVWSARSQHDVAIPSGTEVKGAAH